MLPRSSLTAGNPFSHEEGLASAQWPPRFDQSATEGRESAGDVRALYLQDRVLKLEDDLWHARRSNVTDFIALIGKIQELSQRIFPGPVTMEYACDPEDPTNEYLVFDVVARGTFSNYKEQFFQWHEEVRQLCPAVLSEFRLLVHPEP